MLTQILQQFGINIANVEIKPFGSGLINNTWKISLQDNDQHSAAYQ